MKSFASLWTACCLKWVLLVLLSPPADAQLISGPSHRAARREVLQAIPFAEITPAMQQKIRQITSKPSVYRRLPQETVVCDPELYLYLLRNPEIVVNIWDLMGATQINMKRTGPYNYRATDGAGTTSDIQLVYGTQDIHIYYGEGNYEGPLLKQAVSGRCVLVLRSRYQSGNDGPQITSTLDMFLEVDHLGVDVLAKTFQPFFGKYADYNFIETARFLGRLSETAERNRDGMQRLAGRLDQVDPAVRQQFAAVSSRVADRYAQRQEVERLEVQRAEARQHPPLQSARVPTAVPHRGPTAVPRATSSARRF